MMMSMTLSAMAARSVTSLSTSPVAPSENRPLSTEAWPTARLAAQMHLSVAQFHARFVELAGCTPQDWLRNLRLDAATQQLRQGAALEATALRCGYASASALAYALRRERGVTSRQLRTAPHP